MLYYQSEKKYVYRSKANELVGGIECLYTALTLQGIYLPKINSDCLTSDYLLKAALNRVVVQTKNKSSHGIPIQKVTKVQLYDELKKINFDKPLGFDCRHLPNKQWMLDLLATCKPDYQIFKNLIDDLPTSLSQEELKVLQQLDTSHFRKQRSRFFKLSREQKIQKKLINLRQRRNKVNAAYQRLKEMTDIKGREVEELDAKLNKIYIKISQLDDPKQMQVERQREKSQK